MAAEESCYGKVSGLPAFACCMSVRLGADL